VKRREKGFKHLADRDHAPADSIRHRHRMTERVHCEIKRNESVAAREVEDLRASVGWERLENKYDTILANSYAHFTVRENTRLIAFLNVISDGIGDAFLVDLMVHPTAQRHGIGRALVLFAISALRHDGIKCIQVTFDRELESFYRGCGFYIFRGGIIDTAECPENATRARGQGTSE
jgi:GNAT superfamily N-acetyltransferase